MFLLESKAMSLFDLGCLKKISNESAAPAHDTRALHGQSLEMTDTLTVTDVKERAVVHGSEKML